MSATRSLTRFYGSFFLSCANIAVCPYLLTATAFIEDSKHPKRGELLLGIGACIFLSTVVPILPTITSITFTIAMFAASLALASMFIAYPIALISDAADSCADDSQFSFTEI
jgi:hypothetical protein